MFANRNGEIEVKVEIKPKEEFRESVETDVSEENAEDEENQTPVKRPRLQLSSKENMNKNENSE